MPRPAINSRRSPPAAKPPQQRRDEPIQSQVKDHNPGMLPTLCKTVGSSADGSLLAA